MRLSALKVHVCDFSVRAGKGHGRSRKLGGSELTLEGLTIINDY